MKFTVWQVFAAILYCVASSVAPLPVQAQTEPALSQEQVLERWAQALGGRENLQNLSAIHISGTIETGGLKGSYERWATSQGQLRTAVDLSGAYRQITVFDGHAAWMRDTSGTVHEVSGDVLKGMRGAAYEASHSFLFPGRLPGQVQLVGEDKGQDAYVLRLEAENSAPVTVYLDSKTFLPKREESSGPMGKRIIRFSDWREFGGIKIAEKVHQSSGDARFDALITIERAEVNVPPAANLFEKPGNTSEQVHFTNGAHEAAIPAEVYGDHIFIPVRANGGRPAWFFVDSGAAMSVVSKTLAEELRLPFSGEIRGQGTGAGATSVGLAKNVGLDFGTVQLPPGTTAVWDHSALLPVLGRQWDGIIGTDVISRLVVRLDYEHEQITVYDPETYTPANKAAELPVTFLGSLPMVQGKITLPGREPIEINCVIDSGADGLHLTAPFVSANRVLESMSKRVSASSIGAGGGSRQFAGRIASLQLGPYVLREPVVSFSADEKAGLLASPDFAALIGGAILKRFTLTFDYPHHRILLEPNGRFSSAFRTNQSGLSLLAKGQGFHRFEVDGVEPGSPADSAGLRIGDVLTAVDQKDAGQLSLSKIDEIFRQSGRAIPVAVRRGEKSLKLIMKLQDRI